MYTGLIEEIGRVRRKLTAGSLTVSAETVLDRMRVGDSIAVDGVCLTVTAFDQYSFTADVTPETLRRSTLGRLRPGDPVNLERPMAADGRFGGHFVSGHIDGVGRIARRTAEDNAVRIEMEAPSELLELIVEKGSVAVDGISLTVASVNRRGFEVSVIPHTGMQTALIRKKTGDPVNLETDLMGKYVRKFLSIRSRPSAITQDFLHQNGF